MVELEATTYRVASLILIILLTDLAVGLVLGRTGLLPGAEEMAVALAEVLFVFLGIAGLALVVISWWTGRTDVETDE